MIDQTDIFLQAGSCVPACLRRPCFGDSLWTWADDHEGIAENPHSLRTDVIKSVIFTRLSIRHGCAPVVLR